MKLENRKINRRWFYPEFSPEINKWITRVHKNNGKTPSYKTLGSIDKFYKKLKSTSFFNKLLVVNCIPPDSIGAFRTPLIDITGQYNWSGVDTATSPTIAEEGYRNSLVLSLNGIERKLIGQYPAAFDTKFIPSVYFPDTQSAGLTTYIYNGPDYLYQTELGVADATRSKSFILRSNANDGFQIFTDCHMFNQSNGEGLIAGSLGSLFFGYVSANRISSSSANLYHASSSVNHVSYASSSTSGGSLPTQPVYFMAENAYETPIALNISHQDQIISFAAIHYGLTEGESAIFYSLVQELRRNFGGGFV
jgi:hypothetical protein